MNGQISPVLTGPSLKSKFIKVNGANIHYLDEGSGDPIVFLHGMLLSSHVWRNIIPALSSQAHCLAPDLIGMGKSDKPDISYSIIDHISYIHEFLNSLDLKNIVLVLHGFGSVIGFDYAMNYPEKIKGIAFLESHIKPIDWDSLSLPAKEFLSTFKDQESAYRAIVEENYLLEKVLPAIVLRRLSETELANYRAPFLTQESRRLLWQYFQELPFFGSSTRIKDLIENYSEKLQKSSIPKLLMYSIPGFFTSITHVEWASHHLPNLTISDLGEAWYCPQETNPTAVTEALVKWYQTIL